MVTDGDMENSNQDISTNHLNHHTSPYKELANNSLVINKDSSSQMLNHVKASSDHMHKESSSKHKENSSTKPKDSFKIPLKDHSGKAKDHSILNNSSSKSLDPSLKVKDSNKLKESSPHKQNNKIEKDDHKHNDASPSKHKDSSSKNNEHKEKDPKLKDTHKTKDKEYKEHKDKEHKDKEHKDREHKDEHKDKKHKEKEHKEKEHKEKEHKVKEHKEKDHKEKEHKEKEHKEKEHKDKEHKDKEHKKKKHKDSGHKEKDKHKDGEHKEKEKQKDSEHKEKDKHKEKEKSEDDFKYSRIVKFKQEPDSPKQSPIKTEVEEGDEDDDDIPLMARKTKSKDTKGKVEIKKEIKAEKRSREDSDDEESLAARAEKVKLKSEKKSSKKRELEDDEDDYKPVSKKVKKEKKDKEHKKEKDRKRKDEVEDVKPKKKKKEEEEEVQVWKWWEENKTDDGKKWTTLEHKGPVFAPAYEPLPREVKFYYDGKAVKLSPEAEEVAGFYGKMLEHDYTTKDAFNNNFFKDWRKLMTQEEKLLIQELKKCNFRMIFEHFQKKSEERKAMSKEGKQALKKANEELIKEYGFCIIDGHKEKIGNFKIEPPGLFRGRGEHPKMGKLKKRTMPEEIIINCGKESKVPPPPPGHKWKEVRHDNTVTWLASWCENVQGQTKYIMLNPSSKLKGEKDWQKYETARKLKKCVDKIRANYREDWKSKEMRVRQRAVALYFIDKLALRAGNEKEEGETADTVGCCSLRKEHLTLHDECDGKEHVVEFDFLGKDSIRYQNSVSVEKRVFKNLKLFMENKQPGDDVFDRLNTQILNKHLSDLMDGLTAKVFRTYNASKTLQDQLNLLTKPEDPIPAKMLSYNRANRAVAILCNHQRAKPKAFEKQMENLTVKIDAKKDSIKEAKKDFKQAKQNYKSSNAERDKQIYDRKKKLIQRLEDQLTKLEVQATDKEENKEIALGTSKLNYLDPRISVAWCKKWDVPIEKIYNRTQRDKFRWAIDMTTPDYVF